MRSPVAGGAPAGGVTMRILRSTSAIVIPKRSAVPGTRTVESGGVAACAGSAASATTASQPATGRARSRGRRGPGLETRRHRLKPNLTLAGARARFRGEIADQALPVLGVALAAADQVGIA